MRVFISNVKQRGKCYRKTRMNYCGWNFRGGREIMLSCPDREMVMGIEACLDPEFKNWSGEGFVGGGNRMSNVLLMRP